MSVPRLESELEGRWLAPAEAARELKVSHMTVNRWTRQGILPALRTPLGHLYRERDVQELARHRTTKREVRDDNAK